MILVSVFLVLTLKIWSNISEKPPYISIFIWDGVSSLSFRVNSEQLAKLVCKNEQFEFWGEQ